MQNKLLLNLGLARRAGKVTLGTEQVRDCIKAGKAFLVVIARDVSEGTKKEILDSAAFYKTEARMLDVTMSELSHALGKKAPVSSAALTDIGFKALVEKSIEHQEV